jgi:hypothetical protein
VTTPAHRNGIADLAVLQADFADLARQRRFLTGILRVWMVALLVLVAIAVPYGNWIGLLGASFFWTIAAFSGWRQFKKTSGQMAQVQRQIEQLEPRSNSADSSYLKREGT